MGPANLAFCAAEANSSLRLVPDQNSRSKSSLSARVAYGAVVLACFQSFGVATMLQTQPGVVYSPGVGFIFATAMGALWVRRVGQNPDVVVDLGLAAVGGDGHPAGDEVDHLVLVLLPVRRAGRALPDPGGQGPVDPQVDPARGHLGAGGLLERTPVLQLGGGDVGHVRGVHQWVLY
jgi:hypothetical protein